MPTVLEKVENIDVLSRKPVILDITHVNPIMSGGNKVKSVRFHKNYLPGGNLMILGMKYLGLLQSQQWKH